MKRIKRLKYGEIYEIVGLDSLTLNEFDYGARIGLSKETV
jgi:hypothetical protein